MGSQYEDPSTWRLRTPGGVPFRIISHTGSFEYESAGGQGVYLIRATDLAAFVVEAFPAPIVWGNSILYPLGPTMPGLPLFPTRISWEGHVAGLPIDPFSQDTLAPSGTYQAIAKVTVDYGPRKDQNSNSNPNDPKSFLEVKGRAAGEYIHTSTPKGKWSDALPGSSSGGSPEPATSENLPVTVVVPETEWTVTWNRIPRAVFDDKLIDKMRGKLGMVNSSAMPILHGAPVETVLFVGYDFTEEYTWRTLSQPPVRLDLKFLEKRVTDRNGKTRGHNAFWKPGEGWKRLLIDGTNPAFTSSNLNDIWAP